MDVVLDLRKGVLPFSDESVVEVYASHVLEHIPEWEKLVLDIHRVLAPGGLPRTRVPHGLSPHIYHVRSLLPWTIDGLCTREKTSPGFESKEFFKMLEQRVHRRFWFRWHLERYLGIKIRDRWPIGQKCEIEWTLE